MEFKGSLKRLAGAVLLAATSLALSGCLLSPGKFISTLDLRKGGMFTYVYEGEIHLLALSKLAQMDAQRDEEFSPEVCYDDGFNARECTEDEVAEQRKTWEEGAAERKAKKEKDAEAARAMLGGIDPYDPAAADELAARLRRQTGWKRVENKGDGLFDVSFALTGRIDHDFHFPTMEGFPVSNFFVAVTRRADGTVRVNAPGFALQGGGNPFQGMMGAMGGVPFPGEDGEPGAPVLPKIDGTFTITTDGEILANNTDEGPTASATGKTLAWTINIRTKAAPTALVRIQ
ncbi:hypothetical protein ACWPM1_10840 [Tsuneonella sp. HG249]